MEESKTKMLKEHWQFGIPGSLYSSGRIAASCLHVVRAAAHAGHAPHAAHGAHHAGHVHVAAAAAHHLLHRHHLEELLLLLLLVAPAAGLLQVRPPCTLR
eukprot:NODE_8574_length_351_cov_108.764901_g6817_i0.p2 GENE.NODE_8574_length_351_cov_108.764901_g6817_i0~~NODE_8574_length_351_cov_108.764901_g6817_i0.p2  ORF type:complete len:115 (-),score=65.17 NODE_8574_length_351_cov_108.764901_g6817_i0:5-304(-)